MPFDDFEGDLDEPKPEAQKASGVPLHSRCGGCNKPFEWADVILRGWANDSSLMRTHCPECELARYKRYSRPRFRGFAWKCDPELKVMMPSHEIFYPMTKLPPNERPHAEHSPSSLLYKSKCSGFKNDNTGDKTAANLGELGHLAFERESTDCIPPGEEFDRLREAAQLCVQVKGSVKGRFKNPTTLEEEKIEVMEDVYGYIDSFIYEGDKGVLMDPKFTFAVGAYSADSPQFHAYVAGLFKLFPQIHEIEVQVLMPYLGEIDVETFKREQMGDLLASTVAIIEAAKKADPSTFRTGEFCSYCGRKSLCPKLHDMAVTISRHYHPEEIELPSEYDPRNITDPEIMSRALIVAPLFEKFASHAKARALEMRLQEGTNIPGFDLKERAASFVVTNAQMAWETVKEKLSPEEFASAAKVQIGALETAWKSKAERGQKAKAAEELREKLMENDAAKSEGVVYFLKRVKEAKAIEG